MKCRCSVFTFMLTYIDYFCHYCHFLSISLEDLSIVHYTICLKIIRGFVHSLKFNRKLRARQSLRSRCIVAFYNDFSSVSISYSFSNGKA